MPILAEGDSDGDVNYFTPAVMRFLWWSSGRWLALGALVVIVLALLLAAEVGWEADVTYSIGIALVILVASTAGTFVVARTVGADRRNQGRIHFVATDESYTTQGAAASQTTRWDAYTKAYVDDRFFYLVVGRSSVNFLALKFVPDPKPLLDHLARRGLLKPTPRSFFLF
ncbi:MAG TPA: hypothetical protein VFL29_00620 [Candidatus Dormibacteraeota bacterium]|nr:hypothetical protein [Candidatus Dormibacteraeota bacterium]